MVAVSTLGLQTVGLSGSTGPTFLRDESGYAAGNGWRSQFDDEFGLPTQNGEGQSHHFAAFLMMGYNAVRSGLDGAHALAWLFEAKDTSTNGFNLGNYNLSIAALGIGAALREGDIDLHTAAAMIGTQLCE